MNTHINVSDDKVRGLFNALITWDIYGDIQLDSLQTLKGFVDLMGSIEDYEQPLQPSLVSSMREELAAVADQGMSQAADFLALTQDYPVQDLLYIAPERGDVLINQEAINAYRDRQRVTEAS